MFKKIPKLSFEGKKEDLITLHPITNIPKKSSIEIPQGYHIVLLNKDGTSELVKNQYNYIVAEPAMYVYYVKNHQGVHKSNWGTRSRLNVKTADNTAMTLGGYGNVEWKITNPIQLITRRLEHHKEINKDDIAKILLDKIPSIFQDILTKQPIVDPSEVNTIIDTIRPKVKTALNAYLHQSGIEVDDIVIESINFQLLEEEE